MVNPTELSEDYGPQGWSNKWKRPPGAGTLSGLVRDVSTEEQPITREVLQPRDLEPGVEIDVTNSAPSEPLAQKPWGGKVK